MDANLSTTDDHAPEPEQEWYWGPTMELRWEMRTQPMPTKINPNIAIVLPKAVLQQKWHAVSPDGSQTKTEWRDVPVVEE